MCSRILWGLILFVTSAWGTASAGQEKPLIGSKRAVTVADTITMTQIGDQAYLDIFTRSGSVAYFSPDGSKFAFVTKKGNLQNDTVEYSLLVFRSDDVFTKPHPELVATLASSSNRAGITQLSWLPDNDSLAFIGEHADEQPQLYRVSCSTREVEKLTDSPGAVENYSFDAKGDSFVYEADVVPQPSIINQEMRRRGFAVTLQRWDQLYQDTPATDTTALGQVFYKNSSMKTAKSVGKPGYFLPAELRPLRMSPDGRFTLALAAIVSPPQQWNEYRIPGRPSEISGTCSIALLIACPTQYRLIELDRGVGSSLVDAPGLFGIEQAAWTNDDSVLLINTLLPLNTSDQIERSRRIKSVYAVEIKPETGKMTRISERAIPYSADMIDADPERDRFTVRPNNAIYGLPTVFQRQNGVWNATELKTPAEAPKQKLLVTLHEGINTSPRLLASDPKTGRKAVVLDLNPQFAGLTFGRVELFDWKTRDGRVAEGELYYPPDFVPGKRYPLVIQTHGQSRERFWIDGPFTTAFAAQPLANRGFIVLQMGIGNRYDKTSLDAWAADMGTGKEGPDAVSFFESAIDKLDRSGLIDSHRVGLTGFSRTVYHVLYMLTHSRHPIAAAVIADGVDWGYGDCVFSGQEVNAICEKENGGGPPYGSTLAGWVKESPVFNLDKVQAPLLLQAITAPLGEWEILSGLRWLNKPVEMLNFYPEGEHVLVRPRQRLLSQGSAVDWYCFWLKGEEDPDPAKAAQYARWRKLREETHLQNTRAAN